MSDKDLVLRIKENYELMQNLNEINFDFKNWKKFKCFFVKYLDNYRFCEKLPNLNLCEQVFKGYKYYFNYQSKELLLTRIECNHTLALQEKNRIKNNYVIQDFNDNLFKLNLNNVIDDKNFNNAKLIFSEMLNFVKGDRKKGLFIYGKPGVGKTYLLIRLANTLANKKYKIAFISMINLLNKIKESFSCSLNSFSLIEKILNADVIFLDDIGGEQVSSWGRDDLLFRILNECLNRHKSIFFTSNFNLTELVNIYSTIHNDSFGYKINKIKALRIVDRIKGLSSEIELVGNSYRCDWNEVW